jgi:hypothetical protein
MGVRILYDSKHGLAALYCSTSDWAFGPVFSDDDEASASDQAEVFSDWLSKDARSYPDQELERKLAEWRVLPKCWDHLGMQPCERCEAEAEEQRQEEAERHG